MINREKAIEIIKKLCKKNERIKLSIGEVGSASWKMDCSLMTPTEWKEIGYVSSLSEVFEINENKA